MPQDPHRDAVISTYRYLRLATIVVVLMLGVAVVAQRLASTCWQSSISAYYFTASHSVFVASLCAIGACLIVNHGNSDTEDVVLNYSGFLAFIVAMVPTDRELVCGPTGLPVTFDVAPGVRNNVWAVLIAGVVAELVRLRLQSGTDRPAPSRWARLATVLGWLIIAGGVGTFLVAPRAFEQYGHTTAAVAMFVGVIAVVLLNAWAARAAHQPTGYVHTYQTIAAIMAVTIAIIAAIRLAMPAWRHIVIVVEVVLILAFAAFWLVQTRELWQVADRREIAPGTDPTGR